MRIINIYILAALNFLFQTAVKLKKNFLTIVDKVVRHAKEILQISDDDTPISMIYSSKSMKGLDLNQNQVNFKSCTKRNSITKTKREGVLLFKECPKINRNLFSKKDLQCPIGRWLAILRQTDQYQVVLPGLCVADQITVKRSKR